jgi:hypothetical protein
MTARRPTRHDEVPDADAYEQSRPAVDRGDDAEAIADSDTGPPRELPAEVPEADALDQSLSEDVDDEWRDDGA